MMDLIKDVSIEVDWNETTLTEAFDRSAYPQGTRAADVKAWLKCIKELAAEQGKKVTRKFVKQVMCGDPKTLADGVFGEDTGWKLIADAVRDAAKGKSDDEQTAEIARAELQTVDALWKDHLRSVSDGALKQYHKAVENEEQRAGIPNLTNRQLTSLGKQFKKDETQHTEVYSSVRHQLYDYLEKNYGVHLDNLSSKDFQKLKEMVEYIVDNVYQRWASEEAEEIIDDSGDPLGDNFDEQIGDMDSTDDMGDMDDLEGMDDSDALDLSTDGTSDTDEFSLDDVDNETLDMLGEPIELVKDAVSQLKSVLDDKGISPEVQRELIQQLVDELMEEGSESDDDI